MSIYCKPDFRRASNSLLDELPWNRYRIYRRERVIESFSPIWYRLVLSRLRFTFLKSDTIKYCTPRGKRFMLPKKRFDTYLYVK